MKSQFEFRFGAAQEFILHGENAENFSKSPKFLRWLESFNPAALKIEAIYEMWSWWSKNKELIFALVYVQYIDEENKKRGNFLFFRSDSAAAFLVIFDIRSNEKFIVLVEQLRTPTGGKILEIPAGSIDDLDGDPVNTLVRELEEEVGLEALAANFVFLGDYYFSPGACNEKISLFYNEVLLSTEKILALKDRLAGLRDEGENIKVKIVPFADFEKLEIKDAKTQLAYELYQKRKGGDKDDRNEKGRLYRALPAKNQDTSHCYPIY